MQESTKAKLIPRLFGGLGNQLFIYAAARRLALENNAELVLDDVSGFAYDKLYQRHYQLDHFNITCRKASLEERLEPFSRLRRAAKRIWNQRLPFEQRSYILQEGMDFDLRLLSFKPKATVFMEGYWQSENYFNDISPTIQRDLQIKQPIDAENLVVSKQICSSMAVAIHVRFFDEPCDTVVNNTSSDYYARAVAVIEKLVPNAHYFIFSDQPEIARTRIPLPDSKVTLVAHNQGDENAFADLWLMTQCKHFIIANSTFSWWGAWLCAHPEKIVIAPGFRNNSGAGSWGFAGLLPDSWLKI